MRHKYFTGTASLSHAYLGEIVVMLGVSLQAQLVQEVVLSSLHKLVEDVEVSLPVILMHDPRLLKQVVQDMTPDSVALWASSS